MERKKHKIFRIVTPNTFIKGKEYLSKKCLDELIEDCFAEEKLDGALVTIETDEYVFYGEDLRKTHTIRYENLPNDVVFFDVYNKTEKRYLDEPEKILLLLEIGATPAPIIGRIKKYDISKPKKRDRMYVEKYLEKIAFKTKSAFKTCLNTKMVEYMKDNLPDLYEEANKLPKNFVEGIVLKNYGKQLFGKVVIPAFERMIQELGRYENYPEANIIKMYSYKGYTKYINKHVLKPLGIKIARKEKKLVYERYASKFRTWSNLAYIS
ncbi:MAG: RNA ligase family protein [Candidatus Aenigmarchaeota archaeon]|nr:RNA ligase family protein [Candidatus Aenigmarchaeota archaeon]